MSVREDGFQQSNITRALFQSICYQQMRWDLSSTVGSFSMRIKLSRLRSCESLGMRLMGLRRWSSRLIRNFRNALKVAANGWQEKYKIIQKLVHCHTRLSVGVMLRLDTDRVRTLYTQQCFVCKIKMHLAKTCFRINLGVVVSIKFWFYNEEKATFTF